jgi:hypothetical protein
MLAFLVVAMLIASSAMVRVGHVNASLHCAIHCCSLILVDKNNGLYMDSQGQESAFNIEACWRCGGK